jgi:phosphate transport system substrate-binding protein
VQGVSRDKGSLGYFGLAYLLENEGKLKAVPVNDEDAANGDGAQQPTVENVQASTYQPLARPIFIYVSKKAIERPEVKEFVRFYLQKAPELVKEVGYVPLQPEVYQLALARFDAGTAGSMFEKHGSQVGVKLDELMKQSGEAK